MGVGGQRHAPVAMRLGGVPGPIWTGSGNVTLTGFQSSDRPAHSKLK